MFLTRKASEIIFGLFIVYLNVKYHFFPFLFLKDVCDKSRHKNGCRLDHFRNCLESSLISVGRMPDLVPPPPKFTQEKYGLGTRLQRQRSGAPISSLAGLSWVVFCYILRMTLAFVSSYAMFLSLVTLVCAFEQPCPGFPCLYPVTTHCVQTYYWRLR